MSAGHESLHNHQFAQPPHGIDPHLTGAPEQLQPVADIHHCHVGCDHHHAAIHIDHGDHLAPGNQDSPGSQTHEHAHEHTHDQTTHEVHVHGKGCGCVGHTEAYSHIDRPNHHEQGGRHDHHVHHENCGHMHHHKAAAHIDTPSSRNLPTPPTHEHHTKAEKHVHSPGCGHVAHAQAHEHIDHTQPRRSNDSSHTHEGHVHGKGCGCVAHDEAHRHIDHAGRQDSQHHTLNAAELSSQPAQKTTNVATVERSAGAPFAALQEAAALQVAQNRLRHTADAATVPTSRTPAPEQLASDQAQTIPTSSAERQTDQATPAINPKTRHIVAEKPESAAGSAKAALLPLQNMAPEAQETTHSVGLLLSPEAIVSVRTSPSATEVPAVQDYPKEGHAAAEITLSQTLDDEIHIARLQGASSSEFAPSPAPPESTTAVVPSEVHLEQSDPTPAQDMHSPMVEATPPLSANVPEQFEGGEPLAEQDLSITTADAEPTANFGVPLTTGFAERTHVDTLDQLAHTAEMPSNVPQQESRQSAFEAQVVTAHTEAASPQPAESRAEESSLWAQEIQQLIAELPPRARVNVHRAARDIIAQFQENGEAPSATAMSRALQAALAKMGYGNFDELLGVYVQKYGLSLFDELLAYIIELLQKDGTREAKVSFSTTAALVSAATDNPQHQGVGKLILSVLLGKYLPFGMGRQTAMAA